MVTLLMLQSLLLPILFAIALLAGCSRENSAEALLDAYLARLEKVTGVTARPVRQAALLTYPTHRERALPMRELRVGLLGFLKYYDCDLMHLISERNTILGKVMPISQRLVYEVEFLRRAEACRHKLRRSSDADPAFVAEIEKIIRAKRDNLPNIFWNATFDSPEMQKAFSLAVESLAAGEPDDAYASIHALAYFNRIGERLGEPMLAIDKSELERQYYVLQQEQYPGRLLTAVARLADTLNRASAVLEAVPAGRCAQNTPAGALQVVFAKDYTPQVESYVKQVQQQGSEWLGGIRHLIEVQTVQPPPAFAVYRTRMLSLDAGDSLWQAFQAARRRHSAAWRRLLEPCRG